MIYQIPTLNVALQYHTDSFCTVIVSKSGFFLALHSMVRIMPLNTNLFHFVTFLTKEIQLIALLPMMALLPLLPMMEVVNEDKINGRMVATFFYFMENLGRN